MYIYSLIPYFVSYDVTTLSAFDYTHDAAGKRTNRTDTGTAFTSTQTNTFG